MPYRLINPKDNVLEILAEKLLEQGEDLHKCLVIFPGERPVYFLRKRLVSRAGKAIRSPSLFSMEGFISDFYAANAAPRRDATLFDSLSLLFKLMQNGFCGSFVPEGTLGNDFLLSLAMSLSEELEEIKNELIRPEDIASYDVLLQDEIRKGFASEFYGGNGPAEAKISGKIKDFSSLYRHFYEEMELSGLITQAGKSAWTADFIKPAHLSKYKRIFAAGFLRLARSEKKIFSALEEAGADIFLDSNPLTGKYYPFFKDDCAKCAEPEGKISFFRAADSHGEIYRLASMLASEENPHEEGSAVVLPDANTLFPLILNAIPEKQDFNVSMQCPITVSPVYSLYSSIASLFVMKPEEGYDSAAYISFIKHPYIKNLSLDGESAKGRMAAQALEACISSALRRCFNPGNPIELKDIPIASESASAHLLGIYVEFVRPFENISCIADFCRKIRHVFMLAAKKGTAPLHAYWGEFSSALMEAALDLENSGLGSEKLADSSSYFRFFGLILKKIGYPFRGTPVRGLQILGPIETRSLKFRKVYFLDANADVLPPSGKKTRAISDFLRRNLGLLTHKEREEESRFHFENLINSAEEAYIFYCDAAEKEKSPFVEKLIWQKEQKGIKAESEPAYFTPSFAQPEACPAEKSKEIMQKLGRMKFSPSSLDTYLHCGLRFFYSYCLGIRESRAPAGALSKQDTGTIVHSILEKFFASKTGKLLEIDFRMDRESIRSAAEKVLNDAFGRTDSGFEFLFKRQLFRRFEGVLAYHKKLADEGTEILKLETSLSCQAETEYGRIILEGRADRIDRRGGTIVVADYKTGSSADVPDLSKFCLDDRDNWHKTLKSVQLPFYLMSCSSVYPGPKNASLMLLGKEVIGEKFLYGTAAGSKLSVAKESQEILEKAIKTLAEEILNPDMPFMPARGKDKCRKCPFAVSCGKS